MNDNCNNADALPAPSATGPGIALNRHLLLAPGHLSKMTQDWMCSTTPSTTICPGLDIAVCASGAFVSVPATAGAIAALACANDLKHVLQYALHVGCALVRFDTEAEFIADLPRYDR
ncbi:hypothetical protein [Paraburkholderia youngii]|uniref:DUF5983 family protein n=1 Tax=Paraburkholderia youngii TaxID=2782701 RepID=UPI003D2003DD